MKPTGEKEGKSIKALLGEKCEAVVGKSMGLFLFVVGNQERRKDIIFTVPFTQYFSLSLSIFQTGPGFAERAV